MNHAWAMVGTLCASVAYYGLCALASKRNARRGPRPSRGLHVVLRRMA
jgi:hypothetical protein